MPLNFNTDARKDTSKNRKIPCCTFQECTVSSISWRFKRSANQMVFIASSPFTSIWIKGKRWVSLGEYPNHAYHHVPNIYGVYRAIWRNIQETIGRVLSQGYPHLPFDWMRVVGFEIYLNRSLKRTNYFHPLLTKKQQNILPSSIGPLSKYSTCNSCSYQKPILNIVYRVKHLFLRSTKTLRSCRLPTQILRYLKPIADSGWFSKVWLMIDGLACCFGIAKPIQTKMQKYPI